MNELTIYQSLNDVPDQQNLIQNISTLSAKAKELVECDAEISAQAVANNPERAVEILSHLRTARTRLDELRKEAKEPALRLCQAIDAEAREYADALTELVNQLEPVIVEVMDPEQETRKKRGATELVRGSLGSSARVEFEYSFKLVDITKVPQNCQIDPEKRINKSELRKRINAAKKKGEVPRNIPGFELVRTGSVKTRTKAQIA